MQLQTLLDRLLTARVCVLDTSNPAVRSKVTTGIILKTGNPLQRLVELRHKVMATALVFLAWSLWLK